MTVETRRQLSRRTVWRVCSTYNASTTAPSTHLDTLCIHLIILLRAGPVQARVSLLADEQVREVDLLELELDRLDKFCRDEVRGLTPCTKQLNE